MNEYELINLLEVAKEASIAAGIEILKVYNSDDFGVESKADNSPLTKADNAAHKIIVEFLEKTGVPILSEEGRDIPYEERRTWEYLWIVDPLDGTKEFIKRNGEFTVNIALVENGHPILGVVYVPVTKKLYFGGLNLGAFMKHQTVVTQLNKAKVLDKKKPGIRVVASRSHLNEETQVFLGGLNAPEIVSMGSSLKFMMLAEEKADIYPRFAPTMEWDTAASHAILRELNFKVLDEHSNPLVYNKKNLLNPYFSAE
jgi:3'(2'), 5'-bisphosphate nucleotidase